jgi:hypothetical protein
MGLISNEATVLDVLQTVVQEKGLVFKSVEMHQGPLESRIFDYSSLQRHPTFPTTFYILLDHCKCISGTSSYLRSYGIIPANAAFKVSFLITVH